MSLQTSWFLALFACVMIALVLARDNNELYENKEGMVSSVIDLFFPSNIWLHLKNNQLFITSVAEKRPFFVGSRYGRSSNPHRQVVARNDKFFLGSRYGKRSSGPANDDGFPAIRIQTPEVTCLYTGVLNLYKCFG